MHEEGNKALLSTLKKVVNGTMEEKIMIYKLT